MRTIRNVTGHFCPACHMDHCVLDPDEANMGHSGSWYCFACGSKGTYTMDFQQTGDAPSDPDPTAATDSPAGATDADSAPGA